MQDNLRKLVGAIALLWLAAVVSLYYVAHTPFQPAFALSFVLAVWQVFLAVLLLSLCGAVGARLLPEVELHPFARAALQVVLGMAVISTLILLIGAVIGINGWIAWGLLIVGVIIFYKGMLAWLRGLTHSLPELGQGGRLGDVIAWLSGLIVLFTLFVALAPPLKFDSLVYHLTLPRNYLQAGRVAYLPENSFSGFPQAVHMLYLWFNALGGAQAAVVGWGMGVIALLGLWGVARTYFSLRYAWVAVASLLAGFSLAASLAWGYVDWPSILVGLAFLVVLHAWRKENLGVGWVGAVAGIAVAVKYTNGFLALIGLAVVLWDLRRRPKQFLSQAIQFGLWALLPALPWLLKNYLSTGNPFYPLLFPAGAMDAVRLRMYADNVVRGDWTDLVFLPVRATFWGLEGAEVGNAPGYMSSLGPLLLGLGALAWVSWGMFSEGRKKALSTALWVGLGGLLVWAVAGRLVWHLSQARLYYVIFPALALLATAGFTGLEWVRLPGVRLGRLAGALVVMVLSFNLAQIGVDAFQRGAAQVVIGIQSPEEYQDNNLGAFAVVSRQLKALPPGSKALMLWEARGYYCAPVCVPDETLDRWMTDLRRNPDPGTVVDGWVEQGYTHVLLFRLGADFIREQDTRYLASDWEALDRVLGSLTSSEDYFGAYELYILTP